MTKLPIIVFTKQSYNSRQVLNGKENKVRVYTQQNGIFISGKIKEVRRLLSEYARRYRTVKEVIKKTQN